ncbi:MAG: Phosphoglycerate mutase 1 [Candidatus Parcubacteria bacterium]|jgi:2,3-bisphosphoglycerate-dependent phosphoglycerate mutase
MHKLVLIRHGQTIYNKQKMFCGWTDVDLTEQGIQEAEKAGQNLKKAGYTFDKGFCSVLKRSMETLSIVLDEMAIENLSIDYSWRLNERHYGSLQGQKHEDVAKTCSVEQVQKWRRSYCEKPPQLTEEDPRHPCNDEKYCDIEKKDLPCGESLEDTVKRVLPYLSGNIFSAVKEGKKVIVAASGNSLRAIIKYMDNISNDDIVGLEILTGTPLVYELDENLKPLRKYYLLDEGLEKPVEIVKKN